MTVDKTAEPQAVEPGITPERVSDHFWFCAFPYFEPVLYFLPEIVPTTSQVEESAVNAKHDLPHQVKIFDCDGDLVNEIEASFPVGQLGWVECEPLLAACKFESGLRHGTLEVTSPQGFTHKLGLLSAQQPLLFLPIKTLAKNVGEFFPLYYNSDRKVYLALTNRSKKEISVRCRLVVQQRAPELEIKVPANSARVISVWDEFSEAFEVGSTDGVLSYLRCNLKGDGDISFTMLEVQENKGQHHFGS